MQPQPALCPAMPPVFCCSLPPAHDRLGSAACVRPPVLGRLRSQGRGCQWCLRSAACAMLPALCRVCSSACARPPALCCLRSPACVLLSALCCLHSAASVALCRLRSLCLSPASQVGRGVSSSPVAAGAVGDAAASSSPSAAAPAVGLVALAGARSARKRKAALAPGFEYTERSSKAHRRGADIARELADA